MGVIDGVFINAGVARVPEDRHAVTLKLGAFKTSMLQDIEAGRAVELDALPDQPGAEQRPACEHGAGGWPTRELRGQPPAES